MVGKPLYTAYGASREGQTVNKKIPGLSTGGSKKYE